MTKRFLVFAGYDYHPSGGWDDFRGSFETSDEARSFIADLRTVSDDRYDWTQIVDLETGREIP